MCSKIKPIYCLFYLKVGIYSCIRINMLRADCDCCFNWNGI